MFVSLFQWVESIDEGPDEVMSWSSMLVKSIFILFREVYYYVVNAMDALVCFAMKFLYGVPINIVYEEVPNIYEVKLM